MIFEKEIDIAVTISCLSPGRVVSYLLLKAITLRNKLAATAGATTAGLFFDTTAIILHANARDVKGWE
jgi:hypothetical protein